MKIKIIYETQTGTTQYVVEMIRDGLQAKGHQVDLHSVKYDGMQPSLEGYQAVLIGAPTYDDGLVEKNMRAFLEQFQVDFSQYKVAVFGLGNRKYPQFCRAADLISTWVRQHQADLLLPPLRVDGFPDNTQPITEWVEKLFALL